MKELFIRDAHDFDYASIVDLNQAEVQHTNAMDVERLGHLDQISTYHMVAEVDGDIAAFLIAMDENSPYENENHKWFSGRYSKFLYVDRIVVNAKYAGARVGTRLYQHLFSYARSRFIPKIACEFNVIPPNEPSRVFHEKFGFKEVGSQWVGDGTKLVSLRIADV